MSSSALIVRLTSAQTRPTTENRAEVAACARHLAYLSLSRSPLSRSLPSRSPRPSPLDFGGPFFFTVSREPSSKGQLFRARMASRLIP